MQKKFPGLTSFGSYQSQIERSFQWIKSQQNGDGGFPAFQRDKNDNQFKVLKTIFKLTKIDRSAEIFDPSCADIVGHILEGVGETDIYDPDLVYKAIQFLLTTKEDGMWSARWGINYVYAVGAVVPGLARIGYDLNQQWVLNVTRRLQQVQQDDGGFGQDSEGYNLHKYL